MRIQPQHHDGEGTDASLYAFMTGLGHEPPVTVYRPNELHRPASLDVAATVKRLRYKNSTPLIDEPSDSPPDTEFFRALMIAALVGLVLWAAIGVIAACLAGRL
jgi:hypothetical protein